MQPTGIPVFQDESPLTSFSYSSISTFLFCSLTFCTVWWLISCVILAGLWCPDMWSNIILDISVTVFNMRLTLFLKKNKKIFTSLHQEKILPADTFDLNFSISSSRVSGLPFYSADFGIASLHNHVIQFLKINLHFSGTVSLENPRASGEVGLPFSREMKMRG